MDSESLGRFKKRRKRGEVVSITGFFWHGEVKGTGRRGDGVVIRMDKEEEKEVE